LDGLSEDPRVQHVPTEGIDAFPEWPEFRRDWLEVENADLVATQAQGVYDMASQETATAHYEAPHHGKEPPATIRGPYIAFARAFLYRWTMLAFRG